MDQVSPNHGEFYNIKYNTDWLPSNFKMGCDGDVGEVIGRGPSIGGKADMASVFLCDWWVFSHLQV